MPNLNAHGIRVRYLLFPRSGVVSPSYEKAVSVWCADDRDEAMYVDSSGLAAINLNVLGLPSTLVLNGEGRDLGRYVGPAEWDSECVIEAIHAILGRS